jgi:hypothetical protein
VISGEIQLAERERGVVGGGLVLHAHVIHGAERLEILFGLQRLIGWEEGGKLLVVGLKVAVTNAAGSDNFFGGFI